jgi:hypothetical protein
MGNCSTCCGNDPQEIHTEKADLMKDKTQSMQGASANDYSPTKVFEVDNLEINDEKFSNPNVNELLRRLGPFDYSRFPPMAGEREKRSMVELENGAKYEGEWIKGSSTREGLGVQIWFDGSRYDGQWIDGRANGIGRLIHADGDVYEGEWVDDKA